MGMVMGQALGAGKDHRVLRCSWVLVFLFFSFLSLQAWFVRVFCDSHFFCMKCGLGGLFRYLPDSHHSSHFVLSVINMCDAPLLNRVIVLLIDGEAGSRWWEVSRFICVTRQGVYCIPPVGEMYTPSGPNVPLTQPMDRNLSLFEVDDPSGG